VLNCFRPATRNRLREPRLVRAVHERVRAELQHGGELAQQRLVRLATLDAREFGDGDARLRGKLVVREFQTALGLAHDVTKAVFQWNSRHEAVTLFR
jgi:hypothetical protein